MQGQSHRSDPRVLNRRSLERDHRFLAPLLRPGLAVLDVGCGTGAITAGIAKTVGPTGRVVGVDRDETLLAHAGEEYAGISNLHFEKADATGLPFIAEFDIVTAARVLQWIDEPAKAIARMRQATRPGGLVVALDYNHARNQWNPEPAAPFRKFYSAFLEWRRGRGWDNEMADHLPELFRSAGLLQVETHVQDEIAERRDADFEQTSAIWSVVIESMGEQIRETKLLTEDELREAAESYRAWVGTTLIRQTLNMRTVVGRVRA